MPIKNLNTEFSISCSNSNSSWTLNSWNAIVFNSGASVTSGFPLKYRIGPTGPFTTVTLSLNDLPYTIGTNGVDLFIDTDVYNTVQYPVAPNYIKGFYGLDTTLNFKFRDYCTNSSCGINKDCIVYSNNNPITYTTNVTPGVTAYHYIDANINANRTDVSVAKFVPILKNNDIYYAFYKHIYDTISGTKPTPTLVESLFDQPSYSLTMNSIDKTNIISSIKWNNITISGLNINLNSPNSNSNIANSIRTAILSGIATSVGGTSSSVYSSFSGALSVVVTDNANNKNIFFYIKPHLYHSSISLDFNSSFDKLVTLTTASNFSIIATNYAAPSGSATNGVIGSLTTNYNLCNTSGTFSFTSATINSITYSNIIGKISINNLEVNLFDNITSAFNTYNNLGIPQMTATATGTNTFSCNPVSQVVFNHNSNIANVTSFTVTKNGSNVSGYGPSNSPAVTYSPSDTFVVNLARTSPYSCTSVTRSYTASLF